VKENSGQPPSGRFREGSQIELLRTVLSVGLTILSAGAAFGQSTAAPPSFEAASVKPNPTGVNASSLSRSGGRLTFENVTLRDCISFAYGIAKGRDYELSGPGWLDTERFDIAATFPPDTSRDVVRRMLQTLLIERFRLATHHENKRSWLMRWLPQGADPGLSREASLPMALSYSEKIMWRRGRFPCRDLPTVCPARYSSWDDR
jgi:hypothetical protein